MCVCVCVLERDYGTIAFPDGYASNTEIRITLQHPELAARFLDSVVVVAVHISQLGSVTLKTRIRNTMEEIILFQKITITSCLFEAIFLQLYYFVKVGYVDF